MQRLWSLAAKGAVSALLLYLCLRSIDVRSIGDRLSQIDPAWFVAMLAVLWLQIALLALRWRQIVHVAGAALRPETALRYTLIAMFFNQTLPSTVGGDAARVLLLGRSGAGWKIAGYSVLIDRGVGLFALAALVVICLPWSLTLVVNPVGRVMLVTIGFGSIAATAMFLATALIPARATDRFWITRHLADLARMSVKLCRSFASLAALAALSLAIHVLTVAVVWEAAKSVSVPLDFLQALFVVPPVMLVATAPVSIAGWGVREGAMIAAFSYAGLMDHDGLVVSLLFGIATLIAGVAGGLTWIFGGDRISLAPLGAVTSGDNRPRPG
jgi:uncharacterized membrane protein YbhN (UPF0104 family)